MTQDVFNLYDYSLKNHKLALQRTERQLIDAESQEEKAKLESKKTLQQSMLDDISKQSPQEYAEICVARNRQSVKDKMESLNNSIQHSEKTNNYKSFLINSIKACEDYLKLSDDELIHTLAQQTERHYKIDLTFFRAGLMTEVLGFNLQNEDGDNMLKIIADFLEGREDSTSSMSEEKFKSVLDDIQDHSEHWTKYFNAVSSKAPKLIRNAKINAIEKQFNKNNVTLPTKIFTENVDNIGSVFDASESNVATSQMGE